jgi:hypothetical protein
MHSFTVSIGWWLAPLAVTFAIFVWAHKVTPAPSGSTDVTCAITFGAAIIVSLIAWLIWALV